MVGDRARGRSEADVKIGQGPPSREELNAAWKAAENADAENEQLRTVVAVQDDTILRLVEQVAGLKRERAGLLERLEPSR